MRDKKKMRREHYKYRYKITVGEFNKMSKKQGHKCKICRKPDEKNSVLCVDHCHKTGKIRGLLCNHCNRAIGQFRENVKILEKAVIYLKESMAHVV